MVKTPSSEDWSAWYELDRLAEARFETMGEKMDPDGMGCRWVSYRAMGMLGLKQGLDLHAYPFDMQKMLVHVRHKSDGKSRCLI